MKVIIVKEVMTCDVSPVAMFICQTQSTNIETAMLSTDRCILLVAKGIRLSGSGFTGKRSHFPKEIYIIVYPPPP